MKTLAIIYRVKYTKMVILYVFLIPLAISTLVYIIAKLTVMRYIARMINFQNITMLFYMILLYQM